MKLVFAVCRKIFAGIIGFILLSAFTIPIVYRVVNYSEIERREQNLRSVFQDIAHPEGAKPLEFSVNSKIVMRWIRAEYTYNNMNDLDVDKYYYKELVRKGWIKQPVSVESYKHLRKLIYKKGDYEIALISNKDSWIIYLYYRDIFDRLGL